MLRTMLFLHHFQPIEIKRDIYIFCKASNAKSGLGKGKKIINVLFSREFDYCFVNLLL